MGITSYIIPFIFALILHGGILLLLIPHWFQQEDPYRRIPRHIQAEMIDLKALSNQENLQKEFQQEQKLKAEQEKKREKIAQAHQEELKRLELEQQRQAEKLKQDAEKQQQAVAEAQQKAQAEKQRKAEDLKLAKLKEQQAIEHARKIAAEKELKKEEEKKKAEAQALADARKKAEADKKRKAEDERKKADAEQKRQKDELKRKEAERKLAEETKRQQEAERLAKEKAAENAAKRKAAAAERADKMRAEISGYIQALIEKNWRYPSNTRNGMNAKVLIRLFPSGEVDSVEIIHSSGDAAFDKSAEQAVLRIGRFTRVAEVDPLFFERELRRVIIEFRPEGLRW
ncbi:cell envelope integrity protein TolA [Neptunomonas sp.]|uniref:cell envelope integrity protein TolA n=1 Tax=Neptunomonas sp. TaxID=1971898 RepID=UPI00356865CA